MPEEHQRLKLRISLNIILDFPSQNYRRGHNQTMVFISGFGFSEFKFSQWSSSRHRWPPLHWTAHWGKNKCSGVIKLTAGGQPLRSPLRKSNCSHLKRWPEKPMTSAFIGQSYEEYPESASLEECGYLWPKYQLPSAAATLVHSKHRHAHASWLCIHSQCVQGELDRLP